VHRRCHHCPHASDPSIDPDALTPFEPAAKACGGGSRPTLPLLVLTRDVMPTAVPAGVQAQPAWEWILAARG
jgi:hypothetical protein